MAAQGQEFALATPPLDIPAVRETVIEWHDSILSRHSPGWTKQEFRR